MGAVQIREVGSVDTSAIVWDAPVAVNINDPSQVVNNGTLVTAVSDMNTAYTLNGVTFANRGLGGLTTQTSGDWVGGNWSPNSTDYSKLLDGGIYRDKSAQAITTFSGLNPGTTYKIQVFTAYSGSSYDSVAMTIASGATAVNLGNNDNAPVVISGTFKANATSKAFVWGTTVKTGTVYAWLAATQLREVPAPPLRGTVITIQ
jgi:hypothetical protein